MGSDVLEQFLANKLSEAVSSNSSTDVVESVAAIKCYMEKCPDHNLPAKTVTYVNDEQFDEVY
ncbi:hypothetical protein DZF79_28695 [Vibrio parahaemolyticus]|nr:hypothetical protein [Vibrio parahaemolyticus]